MINNEKIARGSIVQRIFSVMFLLPAWFSPHKSLRVFFHKLRGVNIGNNVEIGYFCLLDNVHPQLITIEDNAVLTAGTVVLTHDNAFYYTGRGPVKYGKVIIKNRAFVGINTIIMPNVTIGECAIVGANSVVLKDIPANAIYAGSPATAVVKRNRAD